MRVIDQGHSYALAHLDGPGKTELTFVKREGPGYPGNVGAHEGTNIQEVLRALIDRVKYLDCQASDVRNQKVITWLRMSLLALEMRAAERHGRALNIGTLGIENRPVCARCGHIQCCETCHEKGPVK